MNDLPKASLESMFKNVHSELDASWTLEDGEVAVVTKVLTARKAHNLDDAEDAISDYFRIDTKTSRILTKGYVVWEGDAYFAEAADAVAYLNENGFACTSFSEAFEAAENGEMADCYETEWYEHGYCDAPALPN